MRHNSLYKEEEDLLTRTSMRDVMRVLEQVSKIVDTPVVLYSGHIPRSKRVAISKLERLEHIEVRPIHRNGTAYIACFLTSQGEKYLSQN